LVEKIAKQNNPISFELANTTQEQHELWSGRKQALWSMLALRSGDEEAWSTDVAVPPSQLAELIDISKKELVDLGLFASILGHIGDGNFHATIIYDAKNPEERKKVAYCVEKMVDRALAMEGTCTGEHGIGIGKKGHLVKELGLDAITSMQKIKQALDPFWIMVSSVKYHFEALC
jgi:D-lactate dehydrogenase (cytochrome)